MLVVGLLLTLASISIYVSVPVIHAELAEITANALAPDRLEEELRSGGLDTVSIAAPARIHNSGDRWRKVSQTLRHYGNEAATAERRQLYYSNAYLAAERALAAAPGDPRNWYFAAIMGAAIGIPKDKQCQAWRLSELLGPYEKPLISNRSRLGIRLKLFCPQKIEPLLDEQLRYVWKYKRKNAIKISRQDPDFYREMIRILASDPLELKEFVRRINSQ